MPLPKWRQPFHVESDQMNTTFQKTRFPRSRPTLLAMALLASFSIAPAWASTCDLANNDPNTENNGGSGTSFINSGLACGNQAFAFGFSSVAVGDSFDLNNSGIVGDNLDIDANGDNVPDISSELLLISGNNAVAVGSASQALGDHAIVVGFRNFARASGIAIGSFNETGSGFAIGSDNTALGNRSTAIGDSNTTSGFRSSAFGYRNTANGDFSAAIGALTRTDGQNSIALGSWMDKDVDGFNDDDEIALAGGSFSTAIGPAARALGDFSTVVGADNVADGIGTTAVGTGNSASNDSSHAFGAFNQAIGVSSTAIGNFAVSAGDASTALGFFATAAGDNSIAAGGFFDRDGDGVQDADETTLATSDHSAAYGPGAHAVNQRTVALGAGSRALAIDSVALGSNSVADRINTVSVGAAGAERQITNVAAGTQDTDAVNLAQLNTGLQNTLDLANAYTDMVVNNIGVDPVDLDAIKDYADLGDKQTLNSAHDYADAGDAQTLAEANAHADAGDTKTLSAANSYTDSKIQQLTGFDSTSFNSRLGALENRIGELDKRINRGNAMGAALAGMSANAVAGSGPNGRIAIGVGAQGGKRAAAFGYGKKFDRASFTLGGAFSGSEKAVNAGFGFDL